MNYLETRIHDCEQEYEYLKNSIEKFCSHKNRYPGKFEYFNCRLCHGFATGGSVGWDSDSDELDYHQVLELTSYMAKMKRMTRLIKNFKEKISVKCSHENVTKSRTDFIKKINCSDCGALLETKVLSRNGTWYNE